MAEPSLVVDTDVLVDFLRGSAEARTWMEGQRDRVIGIPVLVLMELIQGARNRDEQEELSGRLAPFPVQHIETGDSARALEWFSFYRLSHGVGVLDCLIAAIAVRLAVPLYTFNQKHFTVIPGLEAPEPYMRPSA